MSELLKISEAATLAIHALSLMGLDPQKSRTTREMADFLHASENHLSKVMQRMNKSGLTKSQRGPHGGFVLAKSPEEITLLNIYEVMEGPLTLQSCLLDRPVCGGHCILNGLLCKVSDLVLKQLSETKLSDFQKISTEGGKDASQDCENR